MAPGSASRAPFGRARRCARKPPVSMLSRRARRRICQRSVSTTSGSRRDTRRDRDMRRAETKAEPLVSPLERGCSRTGRLTREPPRCRGIHRERAPRSAELEAASTRGRADSVGLGDQWIVEWPEAVRAVVAELRTDTRASGCCSSWSCLRKTEGPSRSSSDSRGHCKTGRGLQRRHTTRPTRSRSREAWGPPP